MFGSLNKIEKIVFVCLALLAVGAFVFVGVYSETCPCCGHSHLRF